MSGKPARPADVQRHTTHVAFRQPVGRQHPACLRQLRPPEGHFPHQADGPHPSHSLIAFSIDPLNQGFSIDPLLILWCSPVLVCVVCQLIVWVFLREKFQPNLTTSKKAKALPLDPSERGKIYSTRYVCGAKSFRPQPQNREWDAPPRARLCRSSACPPCRLPVTHTRRRTSCTWRRMPRWPTSAPRHRLRRWGLGGSELAASKCCTTASNLHLGSRVPGSSFKAPKILNRWYF